MSWFSACQCIDRLCGAASTNVFLDEFGWVFPSRWISIDSPEAAGATVEQTQQVLEITL